MLTIGVADAVANAIADEVALVITEVARVTADEVACDRDAVVADAVVELARSSIRLK